VLTAVADFGTNPGALDMYEYAPAELPSGAPLVVVLHGCTQTASAVETAGWNTLADANHFAVVYPQQRSANNPLACFLWYDPVAEEQSIVQMVDHAIATHHLDGARVFVTGLSAGGAMTADLLAAYPDRFAAGSIMAGVPAGCASDVSTATQCTQGVDKTPMQWGDAARAAKPGFTGPFPRVQIWQGTSDTTVSPGNAHALVDQWTDVRGATQSADVTMTISTATYTSYAGGAVELYMVNGMGHAIATGIDALGTCPAGTGAYFTDEKICSTLRAAAFFDLGVKATDKPSGGCAVGGSPGWLIALGLLLLRSKRWKTAPSSSRAACSGSIGTAAPSRSVRPPRSR
jgi:poly(hydroxyalkanoate) depolymerase family esterase